MTALRRIGLLMDDAAQAGLIGDALSSAGLQCRHFGAVSEFLNGHVGVGDLDVLVLTSRLDGLHFLQVFRMIRGSLGVGLPIIAIGDDREDDVAIALKAGLDDCVAGLGRVRELAARIAALTRRRTCLRAEHPALVLEVGVYRFDCMDRLATVRGNPIQLGPKVFDLAVFLFSNVGRLVRVQEIESRLWGGGAVMSRRLPVVVSRLRGALSLYPPNGVIISAIAGLGYRLCEVGGDRQLVA